MFGLIHWSTRNTSQSPSIIIDQFIASLDLQDFYKLQTQLAG